MKRALLIAFGLFALPAWAHEVHLDSSRQEASVLRLVYADGKPFAFEAYELYQPGKDVPEQVGRTNAQGLVIFLPGSQSDWRLKAYSADGHGVDQTVKVLVGTADNPLPATSGQMPRMLLLAAGLGIVFGLFGLVQLFTRKKSS